ncbi:MULTISPECIES: copper chaperone PCu(A)C [unclassified Streptomyces]|uniref:copper chaperone PCu(A)C n=1 Tax=unclassified Streptomyces TaxID=2593676 RepID=UPI003D750677
MRRLALPAALLAGALGLTGCGSPDDGTPDLSIGSAYMPEPVSDSMAAGFLTVTNDGGKRDELTSATSDVAGSVTLHTTQGGAMKQVDALDVPAHGRLVLESGGNHLMFEKLRRKPRQGEKVSLELHFAESGTVTVDIPVEAATFTPDHGD